MNKTPRYLYPRVHCTLTFGYHVHKNPVILSKRQQSNQFDVSFQPIESLQHCNIETRFKYILSQLWENNSPSVETISYSNTRDPNQSRPCLNTWFIFHKPLYKPEQCI
ncbi:unnamed protein product [Choristocarpus tenellus]